MVLSFDFFSSFDKILGNTLCQKTRYSQVIDYKLLCLTMTFIKG